MKGVYVMATLILIVSLFGVPIHAQQTSTLPMTASPTAPEPIQSLANKAIGLGLYAVIVIGLLGLLVGGAKFAMGAPDAGKWIVRGAVVLAFGAGFWAIVNWLL